MKLTDIAIPTAVMTRDDTVRRAMQECVARDVPGIPVADGEGGFAGRFSIRCAFLSSCLTIDMIKGAHLLGADLDHLEVPREKVLALLDKPVGELPLEALVQVRPGAQVITALAAMAQHDVDYVFAIHHGEYRGVIKAEDIARRVLQARDPSL